MPNPDIPPEIWVKIWQNLRRPVPEPRSYAPRENLLQPDLCSGSLVCKTFREICQKILWTHIATDRLGALLPQTRAQIASKRRLLAHTVSLYVEYRDKAPHMPYWFLLPNSGWEMVGMSAESAAMYEMSICEREAWEMTRCMRTLDLDNPKLVRAIFPRLRTIAVGSIYGGQDHLWRRYAQTVADPHNESPNNPKPHPGVCAMHFHAFSQISTARHICIRGAEGPLRIASQSTLSIEPPLSGPRPSLTVHFVPYGSLLPIPYGRKMKWVSDAPSNLHWKNAVASLQQTVEDSIEHVKLPEVREMRQPSDIVDIDMFCDVNFDVPDNDEHDGHVMRHLDAQIPSITSLTAPGALMRARVDGFGQSYLKHLRAATGYDEKLRWLPSGDAGICEACGSTPPT